MIFLLCYIQWIIFSALDFIWFLSLSLSYTHTESHHCGTFLFGRRSPKLFFPPFSRTGRSSPYRGYSKVEAATAIFLLGKMDEKQSSLNVLEKENKLRKWRKVTQNPCERTGFCLKNHAAFNVQFVCNAFLIGLVGLYSLNSCFAIKDIDVRMIQDFEKKQKVFK